MFFPGSRSLAAPAAATLLILSIFAGCDSEEPLSTSSTSGTGSTSSSGNGGAGGAGGDPVTTGTGGTGGAGGQGGGGGQAETSVAIQFDARVGDQPFSCGSTYTGLGLEPGDVKPVDLRFYVHDVRLVRADGMGDVPVTLEQDGVWQYEGVALLDFEDQSDACSNGTAATRTTVNGTVPSGDYDGIKFTLGVPFDLNHIDVAQAPSPLNLSSLYWSWNIGHVFFAAVTQASPVGMPVNEHFVHLGSTGCMGDPAQGEVVSCDRPNRPAYELSGFDPASSKVVVDLAALVADSNLLTDVGCHSFPNNPSCAKPFEYLGIDYETGAMTPGTQQIFRVE